MKKAFSVLLAIIAVFAFCVPSFAGGTEAKLLNIYGDNMLFRQNSEAVIKGTAKSGARIDAALIDADGEVVAKGFSYASRSGTFSVLFNAPAGSYDNYTVELYENGVLFRSLKNVAFGELWLASGQSNMQYSLSGVYGGMEMYADKKELNEWIRVLFVPPLTTYMGSAERIPVDPQKDIEGAFWMNGKSMSIYDASAVGYYFAEKLEKELNMPVGVISASLGGSSIASWLSRDAIDNNEQVKRDFVNAGEYITTENWKESGQSMYKDMTANFNLKIAPLTPFDISGMIWYQGETDVMYRWQYGRYSRAFDLMQRSYTEYFGYENGLLPIVFTSLASYDYSDAAPMEEMNYEFIDICQAVPESRALISIYDIPLDYTAVMGAIHPGVKQPVGERMANAAMALVYNGCETYLGARVNAAEVRDGSVYVTLNNVGNGLTVNGEKLFGFSVCGDNGVYVPAEAEIVSADTVRVYSDFVTEPVSAAYAYGISNQDANLYAACENGDIVPVAMFVTDRSIGTRYTKYTAWADCEAEISWRVLSDSVRSGYYNTWKVSGAQMSFDAFSAFSGESGLHIQSSSAGSFKVSPMISYKEKVKTVICSDFETDLSDYGMLSFKIRNNSTESLTLNELRIYKDAFGWYTPAAADGTDVSVVIPADGEWHTVIFDLNRLYLFGNKGGAVYPNENVKDITGIELKCSGKKADISVDEFRFAPENEQGKTSFEGAFKAADNVFELFCAFFTEFIGKLIKLFPSAVC